MGYPEPKIHIKIYLWTFWEIRILQKFWYLKYIKTHGKTGPNVGKKKKKFENNKISIKWTSNKGRNKYWMMRLDMLSHWYGHLKVMTLLMLMKTPIIDDWFLNRRKWFKTI